MKVKIRKEINISPSQMAKKLVENGKLLDTIDQYIVDTLIEDYDIPSEDAFNTVYSLPTAEFIEIIEIAVDEIKKSLS